MHESKHFLPGQFVHSVYAQCDNIGSMYKLEDHIKWYARKKDDFLQLVLDDRENKFGEILTKLNLINGPLINSENVCVNDINEVVDKLSNLFTSAAASTFGVKSKYKNKNNN
jgi:hypothetical protein